jgi:aryl-alcohol dehydrogenase-like predicted oxidoreductase
MRYRPLGSSELLVSVVGLGSNNFGGRIDEEATRAVVDAALDVGVTLIDTADVYGNRGGSETFLGRALAGRRDAVVLATKFGHDMGGEYGADGDARGSRTYIRRALEGSLRRLQTDYLDLYQYHRPDGVTPIEETLAALDELVREGKVRHIGSSNLAAWQVVEAEYVARQHGLTRFVSAQNKYSLLEREAERELLPACARYGIGVLPYFPLASGLLTGKYERGREPPEGTRLAGNPRALTGDRFDRVEALERYAAERGRTLLEVAIGALAAKPAIGSVIAGATKPEQVRANAEAASWLPSKDDLSALDALLETP